MTELWTSELHPKFKDRFLKLSTISISSPGGELKSTLDKLYEDYKESQERLEKGFEQKKKVMWGVVATGIAVPILFLYNFAAFSGSLTNLLIFLAFVVGTPLYAFKFHLPGYWKIEEFYLSFLGAEERIQMAVQLLEKYRDRFSEEPVSLTLNLRGLQIEKREFNERMGVSENKVDFTGNWMEVAMPLADGVKFDISCVKNIQVEQLLKPGKEEHEFTLKRTFHLHEQVKLECELDPERFQGLLQFRDRDWKAGEEHHMSLGQVSAGAHSIGIDGWITPLKNEKAKNLVRILGKSNRQNLHPQYLFTLLDFIEGHFLKKE